MLLKLLALLLSEEEHNYSLATTSVSGIRGYVTCVAVTKITIFKHATCCCSGAV